MLLLRKITTSGTLKRSIFLKKLKHVSMKQLLQTAKLLKKLGITYLQDTKQSTLNWLNNSKMPLLVAYLKAGKINYLFTK